MFVRDVTLTWRVTLNEKCTDIQLCITSDGVTQLAATDDYPFVIYHCFQCLITGVLLC